MVTYTTGNSHGDDELKRSAETYAAEIQQAKYFDPQNDTVLTAGVKSHQDLQKVLAAANAEDRPGGYGKVQGVALFAHAGGDGPVFHNDRGRSYQLTSSNISGLNVHWSDTASATFYGCNTATKSFTQQFANAQGVPTYGYNKFAYFSASSDKMVPELKPGGPVYLIAADYGRANGAAAALRYKLGFGRVYALIRRDPAPNDRPRR